MIKEIETYMKQQKRNNKNVSEYKHGVYESRLSTFRG